MKEPEGRADRMGLWRTLALSVAAGVGAAALTIPIAVPSAYADPPAPDTTTTAPPPADPNAPAPPPADPNTPAPPPADPNAPPADPAAPAPEASRIEVPAGGFSYVVPAGWTPGDATRISYGQAVLLKTPAPGQPAITDTSILLGKLDLRLFAGAEPDNQKAAVRLASDMGEFYMPFPGTRINQETIQLDAAGMPGTAAFYEVKFTDTNKPNGQIWAAALGTTTQRQGTTPAQNNRWFVVWLGSANNPVDKVAAKALAESIRPFTPPAAPPTETPAAPGAPAPAAPGAPTTTEPAPGGNQVGVPTPVAPEDAPGMMPPP